MTQILVDRSAFTTKGKRRYKTFDVPGFGAVRIQSLTEKERSDYESDVLNKKGGVNMARLNRARRKLICLCVVDESGQLLLTDQDVDDLCDMDGAYAGAIYDECRTHCGFQENDIEDLVKNSETVPGDGSH